MRKMGAADGVGESRDARDDLDCPLEPGSSSWGRWEVGGGIVQALRVLVDARAPIHCSREKGGGSTSQLMTHLYIHRICIYRWLAPGPKESKTPKTGITYLGT